MEKKKKKKLAFHFIISEGVGTMKGCGRLHPFSIITYHLSLFFSPISLAPSPKRMGTLEGEASSELNLDKSQCVILVLICDATQGQPVCSPALADCSTHAGLHFFTVVHPHKYIFFKVASSDVCSYNTIWRLFSSLPPHSCSQPLCSMACSDGHVWPIVICANQSRLV